MKLLSVLNVSNREKPGCDSGVIFHRLLLTRLAQSGWQCFVAAPIPVDIPGTHDVRVESGYSKYEVRFRFDWVAYAKILKEIRPDFLFVHQAELVANFRALLTTESLNSKLITYFHYWPIQKVTTHGEMEWDESLNHSGMAEAILLNMLQAAALCDIGFVTSKFAYSLMINSCNRYRVRIDESKIFILPCPADPAFMDLSLRRNADSKQILYNHRLYKQYGTEFLIEIISRMRHHNCTFLVTDFFSDRNVYRRKLDDHVDQYRELLKTQPNVIMREDGDDRQIYRDDILAGSKVGLGPYRRNANWSMSSIDCLGMGIPVACPSFASFPEFVPDLLLFHNQSQAVDLLIRLLNDKEFYDRCSKEGYLMARRFHADVIARKFLTTIIQ